MLTELQMLTPTGIKSVRALAPGLADVCQDADLARIQIALTGLQQIVDEESQVSASASFAFRDNQSEGRRGTDSTASDREKQSVEASISLNRGRYPMEVELRSSISLSRTENQEIQEDISSLFLSADRHLTNTWLETFAFLNRATDDFMGINQRYESGGGVVFNLWLGKTRTGRIHARRVTQGLTRVMPRALREDSLYTRDKAWVSCYEAVKKLTQGDASFTIADATLEDLRKASEVAERSLQKKYPRLRLALLVGLLGEIEQATINTISVNDRGWRLEVRPTLSWKPIDDVTFRGDWYFKYGVDGFTKPGSDFEDGIIREWGLFTDLGQDLRTEFVLSSTIRVRGVDLVLRHTRLRDYIPPFAITTEGRPVTAAWKRNLTTFEVRIPL